MNRVVEEHRIGTHEVAVVEELTDEGSGFRLVLDGVLLADGEPFDHVPTEAEVRRLLGSLGLG